MDIYHKFSCFKKLDVLIFRYYSLYIYIYIYIYIYGEMIDFGKSDKMRINRKVEKLKH